MFKAGDPDAREEAWDRNAAKDSNFLKEADVSGVDRSTTLGGTNTATYKGGEFGKGESTEWEDILVKKGIIDRPEREEEELTYMANRVGKSDGEDETFRTGDLKDAGDDELEDELDDLLDDGIFMQKFREQRIAAMQEAAVKNKFGDVRHIEKADWVKEVTEASKECWVIAFLYEDGHTECQVMEAAINMLAPKFKYVKFVKIKSVACVENWPARNLPTLFMYHDGDLSQQLLTLSKVGGVQMTPDDLEWHLAELGVVKTELEENPRLKKPIVNLRRGFVGRGGGDEDAEDD